MTLSILTDLGREQITSGCLRAIFPLIWGKGIFVEGMGIVDYDLEDIAAGAIKNLAEHLDNLPPDLRRDIKVIEVDSQFLGPKTEAFGNAYIGQAFILMPKGLKEVETGGFRTILRHELGHIYFCDPLRVTVLMTLVTTSLGWLLPSDIGWFTLLLTIGLAAKVCSLSMLRFAEHRAEDWAIKNSSSSDLEGYSAYCKAEMGIGRKYDSERGSFLQKANYDLTHYSGEEILDKVSTELRHRGVVVTTVNENDPHISKIFQCLEEALIPKGP